MLGLLQVLMGTAMLASVVCIQAVSMQILPTGMLPFLTAVMQVLPTGMLQILTSMMQGVLGNIYCKGWFQFNLEFVQGQRDSVKG